VLDGDPVPPPQKGGVLFLCYKCDEVKVKRCVQNGVEVSKISPVIMQYFSSKSLVLVSFQFRGEINILPLSKFHEVRPIAYLA